MMGILRKDWCRIGRRTLVLTLTAMTFAAGVHLVFIVRNGTILERERQQCVDLGIQVEAPMDQQNAMVDMDDAHVDYEEAYRLLSSDGRWDPVHSRPAREVERALYLTDVVKRKWSADEELMVRVALDRADAALAVVERASTKQRSFELWPYKAPIERWPTAAFEMDLTIGRTLMLRAIAGIRDGKDASAARDLATLLRIGRQAQHLDVQFYSGANYRNQAVVVLRRLLAVGSNAVLDASLQEALVADYGRDRLWRLLDAFHTKVGLKVLAARQTHSALGGSSWAERMRGWMYRSPLGKPWRLHDEALYLRSYRDIRYEIGNYRHIGGYFITTVEGDSADVNVSLIDWRWLIRSFVSQQRSEAVARAAILVIAYQRQHDEYPPHAQAAGLGAGILYEPGPNGAAISCRAYPETRLVIGSDPAGLRTR
jgi:hypothetical protein